MPVTPSELPIREIGDARLADLFGEPGCPVCRYRDRAARRFVDGILAESVTDRAFRRELDEARGFCRVHTHELLAADRRESGGTVAAAILLGAVVAVRGREIETLPAERGRSRSRLVADARRAAACPVCAHAAEAEATVVGRLADLAAEPGWAAALGSAALCVDHLLGLAARIPASPAWRSIAEQQVARIEALRERLRSFAHHSSHDRRHLVTEDERVSATEAATFLGGTRSDG